MPRLGLCKGVRQCCATTVLKTTRRVDVSALGKEEKQPSEHRAGGEPCRGCSLSLFAGGLVQHLLALPSAACG